MVQDPGYSFLLATESNLVVGYAIVRALDDSDAALLEYLAVAPDRRSQGMGQQLFTEAVSLIAVSSRFLLVEVDSDKLCVADQAERTRRKMFYRRLGCKEVEGLGYIMPPVSSVPPREMDILVYRRELPPCVERARIRRWLERCYVEVYGFPSNDPRIEAMVRGLPTDVRLI
jgi:GNAT superfamily N-acetyltransferase